MRATQLISLAFAAGLWGCQFSPDIPTRAVDYNQAVGQSTNEILLLNIVRAEHQRPRYFTRLGTNSAQSTVSAGLTLSFPFSGPAAPGVAGPTGSGSSENTFNIENLDDKKYQDGAMQPVAASVVKAFWDTGVQPDLLGTLLLRFIAMPKAELPILREVLAEYCKDARHAQQYCGTAQSLIASEPLADHWTGDDCLDREKVPTVRRGGIDYAIYVNNPAAEDTAGSYHPELCFQVVLRDLLALGLHPEERTTFQDTHLTAPANMLKNADYNLELLKQNLKVGPDGKLLRLTDEIVLALDPTATARVRLSPAFRTQVLRCDIYIENGLAPHDGWHCPPVRNGSEAVAAFQSRVATFDADYARIVARDSAEGVLVSLSDLRVETGVRSFDDIISFLGEVVRTARGETAPSSITAPYVVRVLGRQPTDPAHNSVYEETMFDLRTGRPSSDAVLILTDDAGTTNWVPGFCNAGDLTRPDASLAASNCSIEYADHDTMTVLSLVNQIWGLQKEPSASVQPILTLGN
jgi:hypothetical protein